MDFASSAPFMRDNALVAQYGNQAAGFQPTGVAQPNAANLRMRDVLMSQGTSSPYVNAATNAAVDAARAGLATQSPGLQDPSRAARTLNAVRGEIGNRSLTTMFPVVSNLALGGAAQELERYKGNVGLQSGADTLRLKGILGAGDIASRATGIGNEAVALQGQRMGNQVATPEEALRAELAKAQGLQTMGQTQFNNTYGQQPFVSSWARPSNDPYGAMTAQNQLQAGQQNVNQLQTQILGLPSVGLRNYYGA